MGLIVSLMSRMWLSSVGLIYPPWIAVGLAILFIVVCNGGFLLLVFLWLDGVALL